MYFYTWLVRYLHFRYLYIARRWLLYPTTYTFSLPVFFATQLFFQANIRKALKVRFYFIFIHLFMRICNKIFKKKWINDE